MLPAHLILHTRRSPQESTSIKQFRTELIKGIDLLHNQAAESFEEAAKRTKAQADKLCKDSDICEGELVLFRDYSLRVGISSKYKNPWRDVYRVRKISEQHAFIVPSTNPNDTPKRVHLNQIKRFFVDEEEEVLHQSSPNENTPPTHPDYNERKETRIRATKVQHDSAPKLRGEGTKYNLRQFTNKKKNGGDCTAAITGDQ
jgi:hypothetical protein